MSGTASPWTASPDRVDLAYAREYHAGRISLDQIIEDTIAHFGRARPGNWGLVRRPCSVARVPVVPAGHDQNSGGAAVPEGT